jgi:hypothetical protein
MSSLGSSKYLPREAASGILLELAQKTSLGNGLAVVSSQDAMKVAQKIQNGSKVSAKLEGKKDSKVTGQKWRALTAVCPNDSLEQKGLTCPKKWENKKSAKLLSVGLGL